MCLIIDIFCFTNFALRWTNFTNFSSPWDKLRRSLGLTQALPKKSNFVPGRSALSPFHRGGVSREISRWTRVHQPVNPGADTIKLFTAVIYKRA